MNALWSHLATPSAAALIILIIALAFGTLLERLRPAERTWNVRHAIFNVTCAILLTALTPLSAIASVSTVNALGGGVLDFSSATGWSLLGSAALFVVAMDLGEYLFHRAQHAWRPLWAMHSLHHSDESMNVTTTGRHYWIEPTIKAFTIFPVVGLLLKPDSSVFAVYSLVAFYNYFSHMNIRISFGRLSWVLNGPQYHRLHHSRLPEHANTNFAALFPIFDVLTGAYRQPQQDEYPPTGVISHAPPSGLADALTWPMRGCFNRAFVGPSK